MENRNEMFFTMNVRSICGYPAEELVVFANACREAGIGNDQLHDFVSKAAFAYEYGFNESQKRFEEAVFHSAMKMGGDIDERFKLGAGNGGQKLSQEDPGVG